MASSFSLPLDPRHEEVDDLLLLLVGERAVERDAVPLVEAAAATAGGGVHGLEDGVAVHGRLLAVVCGVGGRELSEIIQAH